MSEISGTTRVIGLLGRPIGHSLSPRMQNAAFRAAGLDFVYVPFETGSAVGAADALRSLNIRGANVTTPLKGAMVQHLDRLDPAARMAQAVNVIVNEDGVLSGYITDGEGFLRALDDAGIGWKGRRMVILGAGGAASAVAIQAAMEGVAEIAIFNRRDAFFVAGRKLAALLRDRLGCAATMHDIEDAPALRAAIAQADLLVQATSIGMSDSAGRSVLEDPSMLHPGLVACDLIYAPAETRFLREAAAAGCRTLGGLGMQLFQAVRAFELWTGAPMPVDVARAALETGRTT